MSWNLETVSWYEQTPCVTLILKCWGETLRTLRALSPGTWFVSTLRGKCVVRTAIVREINYRLTCSWGSDFGCSTGCKRPRVILFLWPLFVLSCFYGHCLCYPVFMATVSQLCGTLRLPFSTPLPMVSSCGFGGLKVACWPFVPKFAGSHPAEAVGFLGRKNAQARLPSEGK